MQLLNHVKLSLVIFLCFIFPLLTSCNEESDCVENCPLPSATAPPYDKSLDQAHSNLPVTIYSNAGLEQQRNEINEGLDDNGRKINYSDIDNFKCDSSSLNVVVTTSPDYLLKNATKNLPSQHLDDKLKKCIQAGQAVGVSPLKYATGYVISIGRNADVLNVHNQLLKKNNQIISDFPIIYSKIIKQSISFPELIVPISIKNLPFDNANLIQADPIHLKKVMQLKYDANSGKSLDKIEIPVEFYLDTFEGTPKPEFLYSDLSFEVCTEKNTVSNQILADVPPTKAQFENHTKDVISSNLNQSKIKSLPDPDNALKSKPNRTGIWCFPELNTKNSKWDEEEKFLCKSKLILNLSELNQNSSYRIIHKLYNALPEASVSSKAPELFKIPKRASWVSQDPYKRVFMELLSNSTNYVLEEEKTEVNNLSCKGELKCSPQLVAEFYYYLRF